MFFCSSGGSEPLNMSKTDILRGIITEKLSTAAREILAVVERTVTDYEEEASGFRQEIDRQRRQLELLQPQVKLHREDLRSHEVKIGEEEEQQLHQSTGVEKTGKLDFLWYNDDDDDDDGDDDDDNDNNDDDQEQHLLVHPPSSVQQEQEALKDPDYQIPLRVEPKQKRPSKPPTSESQNHLDLRIRFLEDCQTEVLSNLVFRKCPVQDLRCPRGLQEPDFLDLLRSTFPQLAHGEPFEVFLTDRSRRLQPLKVRALTPEEIYTTIRSSGNSALYVRLKSENSQSSEDLHRPQRLHDEGRCSAAASEDQMMSPLGGPPDASRQETPQLGEEPTHYSFRISMMEDQQSDGLSEPESQRPPVLDLECPRGLQEAEFLDLLRSTFPQLVGDDRQLNFYKSDRSRRLERVRVKTLTPEEIYRKTSSTGTQKTTLYIRVKTGDPEESEDQNELDLLIHGPRSPDGAALDHGAGSGPSRLHVKRKRRRIPSATSKRRQDLDPDEPDETLDPDEDWRPDPEESLPKTKRQRSKSQEQKSKTQCKVCGFWYTSRGSLIRHAWKHLDDPQSVCGVCAEGFPSSEELKEHLQRLHKSRDCSYCGRSFFTAAGLRNHVSLHTGDAPFRCDVCNKSFVSKSSLANHRWLHVQEKPHRCASCPKSFGLKAQLVAHVKNHDSGDGHLCNVCGRSLCDLRSLSRHRLTHSAERRHACRVCGKRFKLQGTLRSHEKTHTVRERSYLCDVCCKTFHTNSTLMAHMKTHSSERPFVCSVCAKGFRNNGDLKKHMRAHSGEAPYGCSECGRFFKRRSTLYWHSLTHSGVKRFTCAVCGKACSRQEHLNVHMRTHNGERPYKCSLCDKAFTQSHCLKTHLKSHRTREDLLEPSAPEATPPSV